MKYKIVTLEKKHIKSIGKYVIEATLRDEVGAETEKVQIWQGFPNFDSLTFDSEVEGDLVTSQKGQYTNITLYAPKNLTTGRINASRGNSAAIGKAMERKETSIAKFQDSKEISIKLAGAMRDSVLIVTTFYKDLEMTDQEIQEKIKTWRCWFLENHGDMRYVVDPF